MASSEHGATNASEYIVHHLGHNNSSGAPQKLIADFSIINYDTLFWSITAGVLVCLFLWLAARRAQSGVPGKFQAAVEIVVEMVDEQAKSIVLNETSRKFVSPLALTVFLWIIVMNTLDLLPVDLPGWIIHATGLHETIGTYHRIVPTADLNGTIGMSFGVLLLMLYYGMKIHTPGGFVKGLFTAPFHAHGIGAVLLAPANFLLNLVEYAAKTVSLGMRLFGNMFAGELIFMLIALLGAAWATTGTGIALGAGHLIAGTLWAIFHILVIVLQAFIFMMLTLVYIGQSHEGH